MTMRIRNAQGEVFEGPDGPVPDGYTKIDGPLSQSASMFSSPQGLLGPGMLAHMAAKRLGGTLQQGEQDWNKKLEFALPIAAAFGIKGPGGVFADMGTQALYGAVASALTKHNVTESTISGILSGAFTGAGHTLLRPAQLAANWGAARAAETTYKARKAFDKAFADVLNTMSQNGYLQDVARMKQAYEAKLPDAIAAWTKNTAAANKNYLTEVEKTAQRVAKDAMDFAKGRMPEWATLTSDLRGLTDAVVGRGQALTSKAFDTSMREIISKGATIRVPFPMEMAQKLGIPAVESATPGLFTVNAGDLAKTVVGKSKDWPEIYQAAHGALVNVGLGSEAARLAYKTGQGIRQFVDQSKALLGDPAKGIPTGMLDPAKIVEAFYTIKGVSPLLNREMGDVFRGPFQAARSGPLAPTKIPKPTAGEIPKPVYPEPPAAIVPTEVLPPTGIERIGKGRTASGSTLGSIAGMATAHALGVPWWAGAPAGGATGAALARYMSPKWSTVTRGPVEAGTQELLNMLKGMIGQTEAGRVRPRTRPPEDIAAP